MKPPCVAKRPRLSFLPVRWHRKLWRDAGFHWLNGYVCGDNRCTGESIEGVAYPVVLPLRKGLLHNVTQSIECEVDLPSLEIPHSNGFSGSPGGLGCREQLAP